MSSRPSRPLSLVLGCVALLAAHVVSAQPVPVGLNHQGLLLDDAGLPRAGEVILTFSLYEQAEGGLPVWTEEAQLQLVDGYYSRVLGQDGSLADHLLGGAGRWLGIAVDHGVELAPRHPLSSVPYARVADNAVGDITPNSVSVGGRQVIDAAGRWVGLPPEGGEGEGEATPEELLAALLSVDGSGSGLDADTLDGLHSAAFVQGADEILVLLSGVDGFESGLDADRLDGLDSSEFLRPGEVGAAAVVMGLVQSAHGDGSGLDADMLDGLHASRFMRVDQDTGTTGSLRATHFDVQPEQIGGGDRPWMRHGLRVGGGGSDSAYFGLLDEGDNAADAVVAWGDDPGDDLRFIFAASGGPVEGVEHARITAAGRVGVGVAAPRERLHVDGAVMADSVQLVPQVDPPGLCVAAEAGRVRYNATAGQMQFCNGVTWGPFAVAGGDAGDPDGSGAARAGVTCLTLLQAGFSRGDGVYWIDPDGLGGHQPFTVDCDMEGGGWTVLGHNSQARTYVDGPEDPGSYSRPVVYTHTLAQIDAIKAASPMCQQEVLWECKGSGMWIVPGDGHEDFAWWHDREGVAQHNWPGGSAACDINDATWRQSGGYLQDTDLLPVTRLRFGDTGGVTEEGYHTLGPLRCGEPSLNGFANPGTTCKAILDAAPGSADGVYWVDPDGLGGVEPLLIDCDMAGGGWMTFHHFSEARRRVRGLEDPGSYSRMIYYLRPLEEIVALVAAATQCRQSLVYECYGSGLWLSDAGHADYGWWHDAAGAEVHSWPGGTTECDRNDYVWRSSGGDLTDRAHLPVTRLRFGDTGGANEDGYHTLGPLLCQ